jgi:signal transduction histidine kinase
VLAIGLTVAQEIAFMLYGSVQDTANFVGHVLKILAFYFLYRAIVETGLAKPFDLLFRDLSRAKEAAEAASRAKDQFLAMLSHELRTPLTPIRLAVEFLEPRTDLPPDVVRELAMIRRNVDLEAKLIEDLLDLTRVARGELRLELAPANAHELVRIALGIGDRQPGPPITEKLEASAACIHGDPTRLQQVFWNLFSNARKYTPAHGSIVVRSYNDDGQWVLEVSDSGEGISPELLPRIFDAFEQGGPQRGRKYGGLGLGLAISKAIVEAHSGQISAYSPGPGSGASFCVRLPLSRMPHIPAEPLQPAAQHVGN